MTEVNTCIYYIDEVNKIFIIINQHFEMTLEDMIWVGYRQVTVMTLSLSSDCN